MSNAQPLEVVGRGRVAIERHVGLQLIKNYKAQLLEMK